MECPLCDFKEEIVCQVGYSPYDPKDLNNYENVETYHGNDVNRVVSYNNGKNLATASDDSMKLMIKESSSSKQY